jgi:hypothetical protein
MKIRRTTLGRIGACLLLLCLSSAADPDLSPKEKTSRYVAREPILDYKQKFSSWHVEGWIENPYSLFCGIASGQTFDDDGYTSLYQHIYWLNGAPHESWNFDIKTRYEDGTIVRTDIYVDGELFAFYPEEIGIGPVGVASSSSDLCEDFAGYCPERRSAQIMRTLITRLDSAKALRFVFFDGDRAERHDIAVSDFQSTRGAIARCVSDLLVRLPRQP